MNESVLERTMMMLANSSENFVTVLRDILRLRSAWKATDVAQKLSKKAMCELVIPFRDKYGLSDMQALLIAREPISIDQIGTLLAKEEN